GLLLQSLYWLMTSGQTPRQHTLWTRPCCAGSAQRHDDVIYLAVEPVASQWPGRARQDLLGHDRVGIIGRAGEREAERGEAGVAVEAPECPGRFGRRSLSWYEAERCDARGADRGHEPRGVLLQDRPRQGAQTHRGSAVAQTGRTA